MRHHSASSRLRPYAALFVLALLSVLFVAPVWLLLTGALSDAALLTQMLAPLNAQSDTFAVWPLFPQGLQWGGFWDALQDATFLQMYANSIKLALFQLLGQLMFGAPAAWALSQFRFRGRGLIFAVYLLVMLVPAQVSMVATFLPVRKLHLLNTLFSVILPGAFSTLPVFIMKRNFDAIPAGLIESTATEGANAYQIFWHIGLPLGRGGIVSALLFGFLEAWNALEQPMIYLRDRTLWPLSLYLPQLTPETASTSLCASLLIAAPCLVLFWAGHKWFMRGIEASSIKGVT